MKGIAVKTSSTLVPAKAHTKNEKHSGSQIGRPGFDLFCWWRRRDFARPVTELLDALYGGLLRA